MTRFFYLDDIHVQMLNRKLVQPLLFLDQTQRNYAKMINHGEMYSMGFTKMNEAYTRGIQ